MLPKILRHMNIVGLENCWQIGPKFYTIKVLYYTATGTKISQTLFFLSPQKEKYNGVAI